MNISLIAVADESHGKCGNIGHSILVVPCESLRWMNKISFSFEDKENKTSTWFSFRNDRSPKFQIDRCGKTVMRCDLWMLVVHAQYWMSLLKIAWVWICALRRFRSRRKMQICNYAYVRAYAGKSIHRIVFLNMYIKFWQPKCSYFYLNSSHSPFIHSTCNF